MCNSSKRRCCVIFIIILLVLLSAICLIYHSVNTVSIDFVPTGIWSAESPDENTLDRFILTSGQKKSILENSDGYYVVWVKGEITNDGDSAVCDQHIKAKFKSGNIYLKNEHRVNESPAFTAIDIGETTIDHAVMLVEAEYFDSVSDEEFIANLTFTATAKKIDIDKEYP